jgi:hypothetical protein
MAHNWSPEGSHLQRHTRSGKISVGVKTNLVVHYRVEVVRVHGGAGGGQRSLLHEEEAACSERERKSSLFAPPSPAIQSFAERSDGVAIVYCICTLGHR